MQRTTGFRNISFLPFFVLASVALLFRLPLLLNPERMNSDHAFIGLQAQQLLHGHWSWFLWGSDYQGSWEPLVGAALFSIFGSNFFSLTVVPLLAFLLTLFLMLQVLKEELGAPKACALGVVWVIGSQPFIVNNLWPYRQWSIFFAILCVALGSFARKNDKKRWLGAGFLPFFALYVDFFTIQFLIPLLIFLLIRRFQTKAPWRFLVGGFLVGIAFLVISRFLGPIGGAPLAFSFKTVVHNTKLVVSCFLVLFGLPFPSDSHGAVLIRNSGDIFRAVMGALLFGLGLLGGILSMKKKNLPTCTRALGFFGALTMLNAVAGFLGSSMASDIASVRYLQALMYGIPFALAPIASLLSTKRIGVIILLYAIGVGVGGWTQFRPLTEGLHVRRDPGAWVQTAREMKDWLTQKGIHYGYADYWTAYRLTFLYQENPILVPRDPALDRYRPYRAAVLKESTIAQVFTPEDSHELLQTIEQQMKASHRHFDRWDKNGFVALVLYLH